MTLFRTLAFTLLIAASAAADQTFPVTTAADGGAGSLHDAIAAANAGDCSLSSHCTITFAAPMSIQPQTPLPAITACNLTIDGGTIAPNELGLAFDRPRRVELDGSKLPFGNGLEFRAGCTARSTLLGLAINSFPHHGVVVASSLTEPFAVMNVVIDGCFIGTDVTGNAAKPNGWRGVSFETASSDGNLTRSIVSGNRRSGIAVWSADGVSVGAVLIGAAANGSLLPNGASGIYTNAGFLSVEGARIVGNHEFGIAVGAGAKHVRTELSSINGNGGIALDWGMDGPTVSDPSGRMPGVPRLTEGFYDAARNVTVVRGVVTTDPSGTYRIQAYVSGATSPGYGGDGVVYPGMYLAKGSGDTPFELALRGDWRGHVITALSERYPFLDAPPNDTSEFSAPLLVP